MSMWTYINGEIVVETSEDFPSPKELEDYLNYCIQEINKRTGGITGSEGPAEIFVHASSRERSWSSSTGDGFSIGYILIDGSLRDREYEQTRCEFLKFINKLFTFVKVDGILIKITGGFSQEAIFTSGNDQCILEKIHQPINYDYDESDEKIKEENERKIDAIFRIMHLNFYRYMKKMFNSKKVQWLRWVMNHIGLDTLDDVLDDVNAIDRAIIDRDYIELLKERGYPVPKEIEEELNQTQEE